MEIRKRIYKRVIDGYFTSENFMREDKSKCVKRAIDLTLEETVKEIRKVSSKKCTCDELPDDAGLCGNCIIELIKNKIIKLFEAKEE